MAITDIGLVSELTLKTASTERPRPWPDNIIYHLSYVVSVSRTYAHTAILSFAINLPPLLLLDPLSAGDEEMGHNMLRPQQTSLPTWDFVIYRTA